MMLNLPFAVSSFEAYAVNSIPTDNFFTSSVFASNPAQAGYGTNVQEMGKRFN